LNAYLEEFGADEDVCLVVKDLGTDSFYRYGNFRDEIIAARNNQKLPEIIYFDESWTPGQLASLYVACNCLVMPYRGEGFGLPILEAMACGIPAIVPRGGASDDFVSDTTGYLLESKLIETSHEWKLAGPALELEVDPHELRQKMRYTFEHSEEVCNLGRRASRSVSQNFNWKRTANMMSERIIALANIEKETSAPVEKPRLISITACVLVENDETTMADCLARIAPFVNNLVVLDGGCHDRSLEVAREYGATVATTLREALQKVGRLGDWCLFLRGNERADSDRMESLGRSLTQLPANSLAAAVFCVNSDDNSPGSFPREEPRLLRCDATIFNELFQQPWLTMADVIGAHLVQASTLGITILGTRTTPLQIGAGRQGLHERWLAPYVPADGRVFIDIGANVGLWTKCLAGHFEHVHAIEPNPDAIPTLSTGLPPNVSVHEIAAWNEEANIEFSTFDESVHLSTYFQEEGIHTGPCRGHVTLAACTVDSLPIIGVIDFIKCDVEGAEIEALQGARELILRDHPWLLVEVHSTENFRRLTRLLDQWDYLFTVIRDPNYEPFSILWHSHCWFSCQPNDPILTRDATG
jgi:FkbM family methyltransferase